MYVDNFVGEILWCLGLSSIYLGVQRTDRSRVYHWWAGWNVYKGVLFYHLYFCMCLTFFNNKRLNSFNDNEKQFCSLCWNGKRLNTVFVHNLFLQWNTKYGFQYFCFCLVQSLQLRQIDVVLVTEFPTGEDQAHKPVNPCGVYKEKHDVIRNKNATELWRYLFTDSKSSTVSN